MDQDLKNHLNANPLAAHGIVDQVRSMFTWTSPAFDAGNFTGSGSMTITVAEADVLVYAYMIVGKMMTVAFSINTFTVGGTPSTQVYIKIPGGKTATKRMDSTCRINDNGTDEVGWCGVAASGTNILVGFVDDGNWAASTNASSIFGQMTFEID